MSQLQEMQIASPGFVVNSHQNSPKQHEPGANYNNVNNTLFMVQSLHSGGNPSLSSNNMQCQFFQPNTLSQITVSSNGLTTLNDYLPNNWSITNPLTNTNVNSIHHPMIPSNNLVNNTTSYPEIMMEDISNLQVYLIYKKIMLINNNINLESWPIDAR